MLTCSHQAWKDATGDPRAADLATQLYISFHHLDSRLVRYRAGILKHALICFEINL